jgi:3-hydroxyacyl-[acyl-carrier-protein] dehydratase
MSAAYGYAAPIRAVDQVIEVSDQSIRTIKAIAGNETFFLGHYPDFPIFPGVFVLEAVHQAVGRYVTDGLALPLHARMRGIKSVRFLAPLQPGDVLEVAAQCTYDPATGGLAVEAKCWRRDGEPVRVASMKLHYVLEP